MIRLIVLMLTMMVAALPASAQNQYRIGAGDILSLWVLEDPNLNGSLLVLPDGNISVPTVGQIAARGRTLNEVTSAITAGLAPNFAATPNVSVSITSLAERAAPQVAAPRAPAPIPVMNIFALGEFASPGKFAVTPGTTLLQFLAETGGMTRFAATKRIQLRRTDSATGREAVYQFDYDAALGGAQGIGSTRLFEGDVIVIPERGLFE